MSSDGESPAWLNRVYPDGLYPGLPFFLSDLAPQGFLGRIVAQSVAHELGTPVDPRHWNDDDILSLLLRHGYNLWGGFLVGDRSLERALSAEQSPYSEVFSDNDRTRVYPEAADRVLAGQQWGSSAGGEQPKFGLSIRESDSSSERSVFVKFSPPFERSPVGRRWADLLAAEWHALEVLSAQKMPTATAQLIDAGGRRFLEVTRFDRIGSTGRQCVTTLTALEGGLLDDTVTDWAGAAQVLETSDFISGDTAEKIYRLWLFGRLIGNNDMHAGNLSFLFPRELPFRLAPVYDMLPMVFRPSAQGEIVDRDFQPPPPTARLLSHWQRAAGWAMEFWARIADDRERISSGFRDLARNCHDRIAAIQSRFG